MSVMHATSTKQTPDRNARRREQTRAKLIDAAKTLIAKQGADRTRINEITEAADVGFGSFYNHFDSKDAIVSAVVRETVAEHGEALVAATADLEDPAEVISVAYRHFVRVAQTDPDLAWLAIRLDDSDQVVFESLRPFALEDLKRAIKAGRLDVPDLDVALAAAGGALQGVIRAVLQDHLGSKADSKLAEMVLRLYGMAAAEATEVANRPFPDKVIHAAD